MRPLILGRVVAGKKIGFIRAVNHEKFHDVTLFIPPL